MNSNKNKVVVISGCSASGKNHLTKLIESEVESSLIVSTTTRSIRDYDNEIDGVHYHFVSVEEFENDIKNDAFVEFEDVFGNYYGTKRSEFLTAFESGKMPIAIVDPAGNANLCNELHKMGINTLSVFVDCPRNTLMHRLIDRLIEAHNTENEKAVKDAIKRLNSSFDEEKGWKNSVNYDLRVYGNAKKTVEKIQLMKICESVGNKNMKSYSSIDIPKSIPLWIQKLDANNINISELKSIQEDIWCKPLLEI